MPDLQRDAQLFAIVTLHTIHGPYGPSNPQCKCMRVIQRGEKHLTLCGKNYPRPLLQHTHRQMMMVIFYTEKIS